ncbi:MAG: L-threonine 3-dehydrogenase [Pseudomonadota bacterium]
MNNKMKAVVKIKPEPNGTELMLVDIPKPGPHDVLVKIKAASICGTDVHIFNWDNWAAGRIKPPLIYGHEFSGEVVELGKEVSTVAIGDYVSGECHMTCGHCIQCRTGLSHVCQNLKVFGVDSNGIFAEYAVIPQTSIWKNNEDIPPELCSIQDPLGNAVHSVFSTDVVGKDVVVLGLGPIGIMCAYLCLHVGAAQVIAVEKFNDYRADLAQKIGISNVLRDTNLAKKEILSSTKGKGADIVFEMSGSAEAFTSGLDMLKSGGEMVILGVYSDKTTIDISNQIVFKYTTLRGIYGRRIFEDWYKMRALLGNSKFRDDLETIITHKYPFAKFFEAMETMRSGQSGKVVLEF